jgi:CRISP-associated protein Cas1
MPIHDLHELPKLRDSLSYVYVEHAIVQKHDQGIETVDKEGKVHIPVAAISLLLLGPGTSITHGAINVLAENGCSVMWVGEETTKFYAQGIGETRSAQRLLKQAELICDPQKRTEVVLRMYRFRFEEDLDPGLSLDQIRGHEGVRVRTAYTMNSRRFGVQWRGRRYDRGNWGAADPVNRALSAANALLNGMSHAAILSGGYSPAMGFIHTGLQLSFVYDVADLYKTEITIPTAFEAASRGGEKIEARVREMCRERFRERKLLARMIPDMDMLMGIAPGADAPADYDADPGLPAPLWSALEDPPEDPLEELPEDPEEGAGT